MKTIEESAIECANKYVEGYRNFYPANEGDFIDVFESGVEYATNWNKINIADIKTFPEENEQILVKDGCWLFVGVRHGYVFFTDGDSVEVTNDIEWRPINFK